MALHECLAIRKQSSGEYLLEMFDHSKKRCCYFEAGKVVLAAGTLNTMRLLFRSREIGSLQGMPALGLGFGGNGDVPAYWAVNQPGADFSIGTPCHGRFALRDPATGKPIPGPDLTSYGLNGVDDISLPAFSKNRLKRDLVLVGMGADRADGILEWRKGKLRCRYIRQNSRILARINASLDEIARRSGTSDCYSERRLLTVHPLGGARLADHPDSGVVNANGRVYGHPGLYVADAAALPAAPDAPPSMTIAAWSRHVAKGILAQANQSENVELIRPKTIAAEKVT